MTDQVVDTISQSDDIRDLDGVGKQTLVALLSHRTKTAAAQALSVNPDTIYERIKRYGLDKIIAEIPKQALQTLQLGSDKAAEVYVKSLDEPQNKMEAAREILNRVGLKGDKPSVVQQFNVGGDMGVEFVKGES